MSKKKRLDIKISNKSGENFNVSINAADGHLRDGSGDISKLENNKTITIKARRSISYGPKIVVKLEAEGDSNKSLLIYTELSIDDDNARCCYVVPDKDYVIEGMNQCYWFTSDDSKEFKANIELGAMHKANVFYQITDTHIGDTEDISVDDEYKAQRILLKTINKDCYENNVSNMLGIIHTGDMFKTFTEEEDFEDYKREVYKKIYKRPDKKSEMPESNDYILFSHLFEGVGNHDDQCAGGHKTEVWDDIVDRSDSEWKDGNKSVDSRMPSVDHKSGIDIKKKRAHYSWDWHGVRFIQVNFAVVNGLYTKTNNHTTYGYNSYDYLKDRLEDSTNMPVIICCHIGIESNEYYNSEDSERFKKLLDDNTNVVAVLHGHTHKAKTYKVNVGKREVQCIDAGKAVSELNKDKYSYKFTKYTFEHENNQIHVEQISFSAKLDNEDSVTLHTDRTDDIDLSI